MAARKGVSSTGRPSKGTRRRGGVATPTPPPSSPFSSSPLPSLSPSAVEIVRDRKARCVTLRLRPTVAWRSSASVAAGHAAIMRRAGRTVSEAIEAGRALADACAAVVRRGGSRGYRASTPTGGERFCTGLTKRLREVAMADLPCRGSFFKPKRARGGGRGEGRGGGGGGGGGAAGALARQVRTKRGGSSSGLGKRVDAEVAHMVSCVAPHLPPGTTVEALAAAGTPIPFLPTKDGKWVPGAEATPRGKKRTEATSGRGAGGEAGRCARGCGLAHKRYANHASPRWCPWTVVYMADLHALGMRLVASQLPVAVPSKGLATEIDDLAVDAQGRLVAIERKTGYEDVAGRPSRQRYNEVRFEVAAPPGCTSPPPTSCSSASGSSSSVVEVDPASGRRVGPGRPSKQRGKAGKAGGAAAAAATATLPNTDHTLHLLQIHVGAEMLGRLAAREAARAAAPFFAGASAADEGQEGPSPLARGADMARPAFVRRAVVYVSGNSSVPGRLLSPSTLRCVWVEGPPCMPMVASAVLDAM